MLQELSVLGLGRFLRSLTARRQERNVTIFPKMLASFPLLSKGTFFQKFTEVVLHTLELSNFPLKAESFIDKPNC